MFMDLDYGTPSLGESTNPYFTTPAKAYFDMIKTTAKSIGDNVQWRGGWNYFKNVATTQYVLAYFQYENGSLYFIVDFTDSLTFGSINEVFIQISGRNVEQISKDSGITVAAVVGTSYIVPNTGLDLTAVSSGNIKLKLI